MEHKFDEIQNNINIIYWPQRNLPSTGRHNYEHYSFGDVTPCSLLETYRCIGGSYCSYLQRRISTNRTVVSLKKLRLRLESLVSRSAKQLPKHSKEHRGAALERPAQLQPRANGSQSALCTNGWSILIAVHCLYRGVTHVSLQTFSWFYKHFQSRFYELHKICI
jgi:hypothetical protein